MDNQQRYDFTSIHQVDWKRKTSLGSSFVDDAYRGLNLDSTQSFNRLSQYDLDDDFLLGKIPVFLPDIMEEEE